MSCHKIISVDFDGTITMPSKYPQMGEIRTDAIRVLKRLKQELGFELLLWTCRENEELQEALDLLSQHELNFDYINEIPQQQTRKPFVDYIIDDKCLGYCVDWCNIEKYLFEKEQTNE